MPNGHPSQIRSCPRIQFFRAIVAKRNCIDADAAERSTATWNSFTMASFQGTSINRQTGTELRHHELLYNEQLSSSDGVLSGKTVYHARPLPIKSSWF
jgi:hypothetical protein